MNHSLLAIFFALFALNAKAVDPVKFCNHGADSGELLSDWSNSKEGLCIELKCLAGEETTLRTQCYRAGSHPNTFEARFSDTVEGPNLYARKGYFKEIVLAPGEQCFDQCRPASKTVLGLWSKEVTGLNREECRECFKGRLDKPKESPYRIEQADIWLYPGMKCHYQCRLEKGDFATERTYSEECKSCVGLDGHSPEEFEYLVSKNGVCWEYDSELSKRPVDKAACDKRSSVIETLYHKGSKYSLQTIFLGHEPKCFEVDERTYGNMYKREVDRSFCAVEAVNDSERDEIEKGDLPSTGQTTPEGAQTASPQ